MNRGFYYIRANPTKFTPQRYNTLISNYKMPIQFILDWVYDVEDYEVKEVTGQEFTMIQMSKEYG